MSAYLLAMLIADKVFREEGSKKIHIAGTFNTINLGPSNETPGFHVFVAVTEVSSDDHKGELVLEYLDEPRIEIGRLSGPVKGPPDKLSVIELNFGLPPLRVPRPGRVRISFFLDGQYVAGRDVRVVRQEGAQ
ncbi:MAG: hypothetical protein FJY73_07175 [Candidatus Eisenbacteria bacterium]|nr:hypothetical protein [Candidatus Eisenbacteria bacterium]